MNDEARCAEIKSDGVRCSAPRLTGSLRCWFHDPATKATRVSISSDAGKAYRPNVPVTGLKQPETPQAVLEMLAQTATGLCEGRVHPKVATAAAALARGILQALEVANLDERLSKIEANETNKSKTQ